MRVLLTWTCRRRNGEWDYWNDVVECDHWEDAVANEVQQYFNGTGKYKTLVHTPFLSAPVCLFAKVISNAGLDWSDRLTKLIEGT